MFLLCLFLVWIVGLVASQEETTTRRSNFLNRKTVNRNNRTKPKPRTTTPAPAEDDEEIPTSPQCPEPDGFFADSEQCDKYYACRYGKHRWDQTCAVFILSWRYFNLLQWHWTARRNPFLAKPIIVFFFGCCCCSAYSHIATDNSTKNASNMLLQILKTYHTYTHFSHSIYWLLLPVNWNAIVYMFYSDGRMTEKLCPDGMVFNDYSPDQEKCDLPYNIDCSQRPKLRKCYLPTSNILFS